MNANICSIYSLNLYSGVEFVEFSIETLAFQGVWESFIIQ